MSNSYQHVVVLDLDDTLYNERDYVYSGIKYLSELVTNISSVDKNDLLNTLHNSYHNDPQVDFIAIACKEANLPLTAKESLLWAYRCHMPTIHLDPKIINWVINLERKCAGCAILTDGRSVTQRLKLNSLGLSHLPAYISEEWGANKPDPKRYKAIEKRWPNKLYTYIGDNVSKDFLAPNRLGWMTIGVKGVGKMVHNVNAEEYSNEYHPLNWIDDIVKIKL